MVFQGFMDNGIFEEVLFGGVGGFKCSCIYGRLGGRLM